MKRYYDDLKERQVHTLGVKNGFLQEVGPDPL